MCAQRRLRSAWVPAQSDQSLRCPHEESLDPQLLGVWCLEHDLEFHWSHYLFISFETAAFTVVFCSIFNQKYTFIYKHLHEKNSHTKTPNYLPFFFQESWRKLSVDSCLLVKNQPSSPKFRPLPWLMTSRPCTCWTDINQVVMQWRGFDSGWPCFMCRNVTQTLRELA